ncbi:hypothetical protein A8C75_09020 [Marinobacterium aestuarii]|uniref:Uncharacterized protein n=2 Tax=Marinobacterium aestuarii TaxID=1821621 RepID=A0A1A9F4P9_9GAMM|nr:hypothetical protein A8C75_09020 [Marinobacterium aestuarii]
MRYGFQRLVLLGSAGYQRAELPLDDAVSLIAPNNTGKTSLINALQFLLIIDQRRMDFGSHEWGKTRRFYFPNNSAYILLEVVLPQTGTVVFGCVGKGVSHEYEYFAYKGELNVDDFRQLQETLVQQPQLIGHLAGKGRTVYRYDSSDFSRLIYGGNRGRRSAEPDFTVFKLEHASDARVFQQVLTRTLRLDKLTSTDVKAYLLQIFRRDLPDASIDFKQEWDKAFHDVNADRAQYEAADRQQDRIRKLEQFYEMRLALRGKLIDWRGRIDDGLSRWQAHYQQRQGELNAQVQQMHAHQSEHTEQIRKLVETEVELKQQDQRIQLEEAQQEKLQKRFALVSERRVLEQQLEATQAELDQVTSILLQADGRSPAVIQQALRRQREDLDTLKRQRRHLDDNLYRRLAEVLSVEELERLNRVLSGQAMVLAVDAFSLDPEPLRAALATTSGDRLALAGLELTLENLSPQHQQLTAAELDEQIGDGERQVSALQQQLEAAQSLEMTQQRKRTLEKDKRQCEQDLADFDQLQTLLQKAPERQAQLQKVSAELRTVEHELANSQQQSEQLRMQLDEVIRQQNRLEHDHRVIEQLRNHRADTAEEYSYVADMPHHPWLGETEWPLEQLAERLQTYQHDCKQLQQLNAELNLGLNELHTGGLTKYQYTDIRDLELKRIIEFSHQLPQEREALEKKARSAVVNVTASLRELRDGLWAFQNKMREFNRLIGHRQLSDLKTFKIEAEDEIHLVEAIDALIDKAEQVETGDSFELFNQASVLDDDKLDRAKQVLIDEGNARQGLKVADLFRLVFVVGKVDQTPESFQEIDGAASNGTVLMAKLVTGLAMLHLMQDKRHNLHAVCYLDEALALDSRNQASLIATAQEFGFSLIFASPAPLTTVRYCVPIHHHKGANHISRDSWQILEPLDEKPTEVAL